MSLKKDAAKLLASLRALMSDARLLNEKTLQAYIVPSSDSHGSEYLSDRDKRRQFISGFTGSSGTALVTLSQALLWTDGRYYLQASNELDSSNWLLMKDGLAETPSLADWILTNLPSNSLVGVDASLYGEDLFMNLSTKLKKSNIELLHTSTNLVDVVWNDYDRPKLSCEPLIQIDQKYTGKSTREKIAEIRSNLKELNLSSLVVTSLDEVAWLLNLRGKDIPYGTVFFSYLLVNMDDIRLFTDLNRLKQNNLDQYLLDQDSGFKFYEYDKFYSHFEEFVRDELVKNNLKVYLSSTSNHLIHSLVPVELVHKDIALINKIKVIKTQNEIDGAIRVHVRDSAVLVEFFYLIDKQFSIGNSEQCFGMPYEHLTEYNVGKYLDEMRSREQGYLASSFETICGYDSNGAIIHYKAKKESKNLDRNSILLVDSGGHYVDMGTTDVTRTVFLGDKNKITDYQKECFTMVLKGHIQLSMRVFPSGTKTELLDSFARHALWEIGLDYRHGTGHGVGALLNVHELPIIANRKSDIDLKESMIVTIEPGYYENNQFGIRIENCVLTKKANTKYSSNVDFIKFEPLTLVPIDRNLIDINLLNDKELNWLNDYHEKCYNTISAELKIRGKNEVLTWLYEQTRPICRN